MKKLRTKARAIGDQQQRAEHTQCQPHHELQVLEKGCTDAADVPLARRGHNARGAELQKLRGLRLAREDLVDSEEDLRWFELRPKMAQFLDAGVRLRTAPGVARVPSRPTTALPVDACAPQSARQRRRHAALLDCV